MNKFTIGKWFWGLFFLCAAVLVLVNQMGIFALGVTLVELIFSIFLAAIFIASARYLNFFGMLLPLAVMCIIYAQPLNLTSITPWPVLIAALLCSIGLEIIFHRPRFNWEKHHNYQYHGRPAPENVDGDVVNCSVHFGAGSKYLHADNLELVQASSSFGAMEVYFDQATLSPKGAVVEVDCSFGAIELYVPRSWRVESSISVSLGAVENGDNLIDSSLPTLRIQGNVSLGAVSIKYI